MTQLGPLLFGVVLAACVYGWWRVIFLQRETRKLAEDKSNLEHRALLAEAAVVASEKQMLQQNEVYESSKRQMQVEFENASRKHLEASHERLSKWSKESFASLVTPVDQELKQLQKKIGEVYDREARERLALKTEIEFMIKAQAQLSSEAQSLTKALKGDVKTQGVWGELVLERILESSGLREGEEFIVQGRGLGLKSDDGQTRKPDVLIRLPGDRHLIVDSKVSLLAYEAAAKAQNDQDRNLAVQEFVKSVRRHVEELAGKDYPHLYGVNSPDFVMMFMPTDGAFSMAHQTDPELFSFAMSRRVAIVSPSLLFPNLRTVEAIWRQERQNRNAEEIARQAGGLYDKFAGMLEDLESLSTHMRRADEARDLIRNKLKEGRGNLLDRVEKLRLLGARTKRRLELDVDKAELDGKNDSL